MFSCSHVPFESRQEMLSFLPLTQVQGTDQRRVLNSCWSFMGALLEPPVVLLLDAGSRAGSSQDDIHEPKTLGR